MIPIVERFKKLQGNILRVQEQETAFSNLLAEMGSIGGVQDRRVTDATSTDDLLFQKGKHQVSKASIQNVFIDLPDPTLEASNMFVNEMELMIIREFGNRLLLL